MNLSKDEEKQAVTKQNSLSERRFSNPANQKAVFPVENRDEKSGKTFTKDTSSEQKFAISATDKSMSLDKEDEGQWQTVTKKITYYDRKLGNSANLKNTVSQRTTRLDEGRQGGRGLTHQINRY